MLHRSALREEIRCYTDQIRCCGQRLELLQPRLHRYALFNQIYDSCDIGFLDAKTDEFTLVQATGDVDYMKRLPQNKS